MSLPAPDEPWQPAQTQPEERNWAIAAHLGSIITAGFALGLVAPLVVLLVRGSSPFVRRHAVESLNFQINAFVHSVVLIVLAFLLVGLPLLIAYGILYLVCVVRGSVRASHGRDFRYPLTVRLVH
jgi:uncharacterized protein